MSEEVVDNTGDQPFLPPEAYSAIAELGLPQDLSERAEAVANYTFEDYIRIAALLHATLAPRADINPTDNPMKIKSPDGSYEKVLATAEERVDLFHQSAELVSELARKPFDGQEQAFLNRAANIAALSVVLAHPYEDGNGRTARVMAHLIRNGYSGGETVKSEIEILGVGRPSQGFRINSYVPTGQGLDLPPKKLLEVAASADLPLAEHKAYHDKCANFFTTPYGESADEAQNEEKSETNEDSESKIPAQQIRIDANQINQIGELLAYSTKLRREGKANADQEILHVLERLKASAAAQVTDTRGYEIATCGTLIGALKPRPYQTKVMEYLYDNKLLPKRDLDEINTFMDEVEGAKEHYGQESERFASYLHERLNNPHTRLNMYLQQLQDGGLPTDALRLLQLTIAHSASLDPKFRNSDIVELIAAFTD